MEGIEINFTNSNSILYILMHCLSGEIGTNGLVSQTSTSLSQDGEDTSLTMKNKQLNSGGIDLNKSLGSGINHLTSMSLNDNSKTIEGEFNFNHLYLHLNT